MVWNLAAGSGVSVSTDVPSSTLTVGISSTFIRNVKDPTYGAVGDGTTDDAAAIQAAIDAAESVGGSVYLPRGIYIVGTMLVCDSNSVKIYGEGKFQTTLKRKSGATIASVLHMGVTSGSSQTNNLEIADITFDGNSGCTDSIVKLRNVGNSTFRRLKFQAGANGGFRTDTSTTSINTNQFANLFEDLYAVSNTGVGLKFQGEKDGRFGRLFAYGNTGDGTEFKGFKYDGGTLAETTECVIDSILAAGNTGSAVVLDQVEKFNLNGINSNNNGGYGVRLKSTLLSASGNGSNSAVIGNLISRNDALGGIAALEADTASVNSFQVGNALLIGFGSSVNARGIILQGVTGANFGRVKVVGFPGDGVKIENGMPLNSAADSAHIKFDTLVIDSNGHASATTNFGLTIIDSTSYVQIGTLYSANTQTSGSNYELNVGTSAGPVQIGRAILIAATGGNEVTSSLSTAVQIGQLQCRAGAGPLVLAIRDGITAPSNSINGFAQIYIDVADGDLKIRYSDGTVKTIVVDT